MNKRGRRLLAVCLAVVMLSCLSLPAFAANADNVKHYQAVCCIGDSTSAGYGINNFNWNDMSNSGWGWGWGWDGPKAHFGVADNAFPGIIRDAVGGEYYSMTCVGLWLVDALWILGDYEDEYDRQESYDYHYVHQNQPARWNSIEYMHDSGEGIENVRNSSLVIISIGANDVFTFPKNASTVDDELDFELFIKNMIKGYARFVDSYPKLVARVKELNPNCDIVLVSQFNPYSNFTFSEGGLKSAGAIADTYINDMNLKIALWAKTYGATYVDVTSITDNEEEFPSLALMDEDFFEKFGRLDNHPGEVGHQAIANLILEKLPVAEKKLTLPQSGINRLVLNGENAGNCIIRRSGLGYTIKTMDGKYLNFDSNKNGIVLGDTASTVWTWNNGFYTTATVTTTSYTLLFKLPVKNSYKTTVYLTCADGEFAATQSAVSGSVYAAN